MAWLKVTDPNFAREVRAWKEHLENVAKGVATGPLAPALRLAATNVLKHCGGKFVHRLHIAWEGLLLADRVATDVRRSQLAKELLPIITEELELADPSPAPPRMTTSTAAQFAGQVPPPDAEAKASK